VGAIFFSDHVEKYIPPASGRSHILYIIRELLVAPAKDRRTDVAQALEYVVRVQKRRAVVFLLSDFLNQQDFHRPLSIAARRHDVVALHLTDKRLAHMPDVGFIKLYDAETGHEQYVDTSSRHVREAQTRWWQLHVKTLTDQFNRCGVDHADLATDADYVPRLMALLARRG